TAANQRWRPSGPVSRARSSLVVRPAASAAATASAAASGCTGTPASAAKSLPEPAGTIPNGTPVPATACSARCMVPSPPTATRAGRRRDRLDRLLRRARLDRLDLVLQRGGLIVAVATELGLVAAPAPAVVEERDADRAEVQQGERAGQRAHPERVGRRRDDRAE